MHLGCHLYKIIQLDQTIALLVVWVVIQLGSYNSSFGGALGGNTTGSYNTGVGFGAVSGNSYSGNTGVGLWSFKC